MNKKFYLGSHVSMNAKNDYLIGSAKETISNNANTLMFFTGAPQNMIRKSVEELNVSEFQKILQENDIDIKKVICHGPYIMNLANTIKQETFQFSVRFLKEELQRLELIGVHTVIIHPGSAVGLDRTAALENIAKGINLVYEELPNSPVKIALETMSGKGNEVCINFTEIKFVLDRIKRKEMLGVCFDTCHMHDSGYDIKNNFEEVMDEFNKLIGLEKLFAIHLNDSKNPINSHKDRHQNIGYGYIGFKALANIVHDIRFKEIPIILETPWINEKVSPYKAEIEMLEKNEFKDNFNI